MFVVTTNWLFQTIYGCLCIQVVLSRYCSKIAQRKWKQNLKKKIKLKLKHDIMQHKQRKGVKTTEVKCSIECLRIFSVESLGGTNLEFRDTCVWLSQSSATAWTHFYKTFKSYPGVILRESWLCYCIYFVQFSYIIEAVLSSGEGETVI